MAGMVNVSNEAHIRNGASERISWLGLGRWNRSVSRQRFRRDRL